MATSKMAISKMAISKMAISKMAISKMAFHFCKWAQYGIDLPGSLHTNKIPAILGRYPLLGFFCRLNIVPLDRDNGTSNSSNTDVVEKVNCLVAASKHGGTSVAEGSP